MAEENQQWLLNGDCNICRRSKYCSKPCTANKRAVKAKVQSDVAMSMLNLILERMSDKNG